MATLRVLCSVQHPSASPPISERHATSTLASSLLHHPMQTPHGAALMALTNQGLPPRLISLAASRQLELLAATSSSGTYVGANVEDILHRRIVELKEREKRELAVQEILFVLVASRLLHAVLASSPHVDSCRDATLQSAEQPAQYQQDAPRLDDLLLAIHAPEVQPLTSRHVGMVINGGNHADNRVEPNTFAHVGQFELGKMYAASVMHGYFLARVHQRFKLEQWLQVEFAPMEPYSHAAKSKEVVSMGAYIEGLHGFQDEGTIRRITSLSCPLTLNVIERHCEAMFGSAPCRKSHQVETSEDNDAVINIQLGFVRTLIYQALAFGTLLWDTEHSFGPLLYPYICQDESSSLIT